MEENTATYELYIWGKRADITKETFDSRRAAKKEAEARATQLNGWDMKPDDNTELMVDYNHSDNPEDFVISRVRKL